MLTSLTAISTPCERVFVDPQFHVICYEWSDRLSAVEFSGLSVPFVCAALVRLHV